MTSPRGSQPATLLNDGQVLMAAGTADLYNPATGKFTPTGTILSTDSAVALLTRKDALHGHGRPRSPWRDRLMGLANPAGAVLGAYT